MFRNILFLSIALIGILQVYAYENNLHQYLNRTRNSLLDSTWPVDHADTARSKISINAGLCPNVREEDLKVKINHDIKTTQWIYTAGNNSDILYTISGSNTEGFNVYKINATTLEIMQKSFHQQALYLGGMLMHRNGHVYYIMSNILTVFWDGDLTNYTRRELPSNLNSKLVMTNGMLATQDGYILVKQWPMILSDLGLYTVATNSFIGVLIALFIIFGTVVYRNMNTKASMVSRLASTVFFGGLLGLIGWYFVFVLLLSSKAGSFGLLRFISDSLIDPRQGGGELKVIDPITLEIVADATLPERCSFARMAMSHIVNAEGEEEDAITVLGDENIHQYRWRPRTKELFWIPKWSRQYRLWGDGSFPGTGPAIYKDVVYYTDNTFPIYVADNTYSIFSASIDKIEDRDGNSEIINSHHYVPAFHVDQVLQNYVSTYWYVQKPLYPSANSAAIVPKDKSSQGGFMYWSIAINPIWGDYEGSVIVWDTAQLRVESRLLNNISHINWEVTNIRHADCVTSLPDKGHIYLTDYTVGPNKTNHWLGAMSSFASPEYRQASKIFTIVDSKSGNILLKKQIPDSYGMNPSLLVPGKFNDVYIGMTNGIVRIYSDETC